MRFKPTSSKWAVGNLFDSNEMKFNVLVSTDWNVSKTLLNIYDGAYRQQQITNR